MAATAKPKGVKAKPPDDVPQFFRLNVEVGDLGEATSFYAKLLGIQGRNQPGTAATSIAARLPCKW